jgi:DNA transformation protein
MRAHQSDGFKDFVLDQLGGLRDVTARSMFGGHGLYQQGIFFGIVHKGRLYFKVSPATLGTFQEHGMKPFQPNKKQTLRTYYEVPVDVTEDPEQLLAWANQAIHEIQTQSR